MTKTEAPRHPKKVRGIYLRFSSARVDESFNPLNSGQHLGGQMVAIEQSIVQMVDTEQGRDSGLLYGTKFKFLYRNVADPAKPSPDDDPVVAEIEAEFAAEYTDVPENYTRREQERFGARSVTAHVWPYWREFLHSSLLRMAMPPVAMPPLWLPPASQDDEKSADSTQAVPGRD